MMSDSTCPESPSLCVVVRYPFWEPLFCSIVQLDPVTPDMMKNPRKRIYAKWMAHLSWPETIKDNPLPWVSTSCKDDLYFLPDLPLGVCETRPFYGAAFNCSTKSFQPIKQPHSYKLGGVAVTVQHNIYFIAHPSSYEYLEGFDVFERYNPATQLWEKQVPLPVDRLSKCVDDCQIKASAVWEDTILLNIAGCDIWAYNVTYCEWYRVYLHGEAGWRGTNRCLDIEGDAFCVGHTLYALSQYFGSVMSLFLKKEGVGPELKYSCGFLSELILNPMNKRPDRVDDMYFRSRYCFLLGQDSLCFVHSYRYSDSVNTQPIQVSYIKLMEEGKMTLTVEYCYWVPLVDRQQFDLGSCFCLPYGNGNTTALKPCETFIFDPFLGTASPGIPVQEEEKVARPKQGRTVIVINLPPDATVRQLEKIMKKFGHLERDKIQLIRDATEKYHCAFVEFKSAAARRRAIEASPIRIGGCRADILELRGTSSVKVGNNVEISKNLKRKR